MDENIKIGTQHDAAQRLWSEIEAVDGDSASRTARAVKVGKLLYQLRLLYSERESGGGRRCSGHGTWQRECEAHGYKPRRARELVRDHEVRVGLRPPADSTAAIQKARRLPVRLLTPAIVEKELAYFCSLLPFSALKVAYHAGLQEIRDRGGSASRIEELKSAWEMVVAQHSVTIEQVFNSEEVMVN